LQSVHPFEALEHGVRVCPLCKSALHTKVDEIEAISRSLLKLTDDLSSSEGERARVQDYLEGIKKERDALQASLNERQVAIGELLRTNESARRLRDANLRRAEVVGRISLWLESVQLTDPSAPLRERILRLRATIANLEQELDSDDVENRVQFALGRIGKSMTEWAKRLEIEYAGDPIRLDPRLLLTVVDTEGGPVALDKIGSGQNWLSHHLMAHLALHRHFVEKARPVPRFLMLDQPSQVYYPPDRDREFGGRIDALLDEDRVALLRMYDMIFKFADESGSEMQVIVTDHAELTDPRFKSAMRERWRGGAGLVPSSWYETK